MARTKAEIRAFLNAQVGGVPQHPAPYGPGSGQDLSGQCVTLIKVLMDFLGVPNPYAARGNAKDVGDTLLRQGIAKAGSGWLNVVVNRDMGYIGGVHYGHIWIDLANEANFESNGNRALHTTKNTRPIQQGQQIVNLDQYIKEENPVAIIQNADNWWWRLNKLHLQVLGRPWGNRAELAWWAGKDTLTFIEQISDSKEADTALNWQTVGEVAVRDKWDQQIYALQDALKGTVSKADLEAAQKTARDLSAALEQAKIDAAAKVEERKKLDAQILEYQKELSEKAASDAAADKGIAAGLRALWRIITGGK